MGIGKREGDFRDAIVAASERALKRAGMPAQASPLQAGISYCVPAPVDPSRVVCRLKVSAFLGVGILLGSLAFGVLMAVLAVRLTGDTIKTMLGIVGVVGGVGGVMLAGSIGSWFEARLSQAHIKRHLGDFWSDRTIVPHFASIENAHTYDRLKVVGDDLGILLIHPEAHCVEIEGIRFRYLIYAGDVRFLSLHKNQRTILLGYEVDGEQIDLAIVPRGVLGGYKLQPADLGSGLLGLVCQAISDPEEMAE